MSSRSGRRGCISSPNACCRCGKFTGSRRGNQYQQRYLDLIVNPDSRRVSKRPAGSCRPSREVRDRSEVLEMETPMMQPMAGGGAARSSHTTRSTWICAARRAGLSDGSRSEGWRIVRSKPQLRNEGSRPSWRVHDGGVLRRTKLPVADDDDRGLVRSRQAGCRLRSDRLRQHQISRRLRSRVASRRLPGRRSRLKRRARRRSRNRDTVAALARQLHVEGEAGRPRQDTTGIFEASTKPLIQARHDYDQSLCSASPTIGDRRALRKPSAAELANAFSELNDPAEQRRRFEDQLKERARGDLEARRWTGLHSRAQYGLPPTAGGASASIVS